MLLGCTAVVEEDFGYHLVCTAEEVEDLGCLLGCTVVVEED